MFKRIFKEFTIVMGISLLVCSIIYYMVVSNILLESTKDSMYSILYLLDHMITEESLDEDIDFLHEFLNDKPERFTIVHKNGTVLIDTDVDKDAVLDNHMSREEIKEAFDSGKGYAIRYSETLNKNMLYTAIICDDGEYVYRVAVPYEGITSYYPTIVPSFLFVILVSFLIALVFSYYFSKSISDPLKEISDEMLKFDHDEQITFKVYKDEELRNIVNTTESMMHEIQMQLVQLRKEKKIRQEFFSNASHELKTPLTSIRGYVELLESGVITDPIKQQDFYQRIIKEADSMTQLINDILMISKLESADVEVVESEVHLQDICNEVLEIVSPLADKQQVEIYTNIENKSVITVYQHVHHILQNLMSNAIKYNKENGSVHVVLSVKDGLLMIQVEDDGMGIKDEDKERIFERFYRQDKGRSKRIGGTGLGLSIVKHIVNYHQGSIRLTSKEDVGTIITVFIPVKEC